MFNQIAILKLWLNWWPAWYSKADYSLPREILQIRIYYQNIILFCWKLIWLAWRSEVWSRWEKQLVPLPLRNQLWREHGKGSRTGCRNDGWGCRLVWLGPLHAHACKCWQNCFSRAVEPRTSISCHMGLSIGEVAKWQLALSARQHTQGFVYPDLGSSSLSHLLYCLWGEGHRVQAHTRAGDNTRVWLSGGRSDWEPRQKLPVPDVLGACTRGLKFIHGAAEKTTLDHSKFLSHSSIYLFSANCYRTMYSKLEKKEKWWLLECWISS